MVQDLQLLGQESHPLVAPLNTNPFAQLMNLLLLSNA
jgi:hypothetical protein